VSDRPRILDILLRGAQGLVGEALQPEETFENAERRYPRMELEANDI